MMINLIGIEQKLVWRMIAESGKEPQRSRKFSVELRALEIQSIGERVSERLNQLTSARPSLLNSKLANLF